MVQSWLQGKTKIRAFDNVVKMYNHKYSYLTWKAGLITERENHFSPTIELSSLHYTRVAISSWAVCLVRNRVYKGIGNLSTSHSSDAPDIIAWFTANTIEQKDLMQFNMKLYIEQLKQRDPCLWYITECMAASRKKGVTYVKKLRPHPLIQASAISSFIVSRNRLSIGIFPLILGIFHFACKSHVGLKRIYSLQGMAETALSELQDKFQKSARVGILSHSTTIDNTQEHAVVHEFGMGRTNTTRTGCGGTAIGLHGVKQHTFCRSDYLERIIANERSQMTPQSLLNEVDWDRMRSVMALHTVHALINFSPSFDDYHSDLSKIFHSEPIAVHRMPEGRKTKVQPLGSNTENEMSTQGMKRAIIDFDAQKGLKAEDCSDLLDWYTGDGGSFKAMCNARQYGFLTVTHQPEDIQEDYETLSGKLFTPEIWHTRSTMLNSLAANHFGPAVTADPSAISRSAAATGSYSPNQSFKNIKFYPCSRTLTLCWNAQVLNLWDIVFEVPSGTSLADHCERLKKENRLPTLEELIRHGESLVDRFMSQSAYQRALSKELHLETPENLRAPTAEPWNPPLKLHSTSEESSKVHKEAPGFDGDCVLANSILFLMEYGYWIEASYAIPDGDIGRYWEVMKIWIFVFAGSKNHNYVTFLLEMYCLLQYKSSMKLQDAIIDNLLVNVTGEIGHRIERDLLQEHYNRWLEDMIQRSGGDFDNFLHRKLISPNLEFFLRIKEVIEEGFELKHCTKSHTSQSLRDEYKALLQLYKEEMLHWFRSGRSMGHAAENLFDIGFEKLLAKMEDFLRRSRAYAKVVEKMESRKCVIFECLSLS
ncbi:hypothetical protein BT96DRAFT_828278 [Gymnopus androsaceus JB14]|uniref:DUF6589 domain-containing protein n=1 Tax=Gymnopus androsaceus JB14 TaxID=1447944 RepID=A0A6A4H8T0_9AGAR|nr:hypothetical protein BT96DRAFT_828278 [Gymnopus androsaceus JB14]